MAAEALQRGAQDYIIKDEVNPELLSRSLSYAVSRKRAELALRRSDARFRAAVEGSLDAVGILAAVRDESGRVIDFVVAEVNGNAARLIGRPRDEIVSRRLSELWPHQSLRPFVERSVSVMEAREALEEEVGVSLPGAGRPLDPSPDRAPRGRGGHRRPRHHRPPPGRRGPPPARGAGAPVAEDGGDRPPGRAEWPTTSTTSSPSSAGMASSSSASSPGPSAAPQPAGDRPRRRARLRPHPPAPGLQPQAGPAAAHPGPRRGGGADEQRSSSG